MSIDYSFTLCVGYVLPWKELDRVFKREAAGKAHMENRYDPKTGKPIESVKVWDEPATEYYELDDELFEDSFEFIEALTAKLQCGYADTHLEDGNEDDVGVGFTVEMPEREDFNLDWGRVSVSGVFHWKDVVTAGLAIKLLGEHLSGIGLDPGPAKVFIAANVN